MTVTLLLLSISWYPAQGDGQQCLKLECTISDQDEGCGPGCSCYSQTNNPAVGVCGVYYDYPDYETAKEPQHSLLTQDAQSQQHTQIASPAHQGHFPQNGQQSQYAQQGPPIQHAQPAQPPYQGSMYPSYAGGYMSYPGPMAGGGNAALLGVSQGISGITDLAQQLYVQRQMMRPPMPDQTVAAEMPPATPPSPSVPNSAHLAPIPNTQTENPSSDHPTPVAPQLPSSQQTSKKRPAPQPPTNGGQSQPSLKKPSPPPLPSKAHSNQAKGPAPLSPPPRQGNSPAGLRPVNPPKKTTNATPSQQPSSKTSATTNWLKN
uniref:Putative vegetative cell wall protein gp1 n=1 Tax=Amblyomma cajennense TaxID=34607 RepID=A0A023FC74_AMBCJ